MGNCHCIEQTLNEPTLKTRPAQPDDFNMTTMHPRLAKLAELAIANQHETVTKIDLNDRDLGEEGGACLQNLLQYFTHISGLLLRSTKLEPENWPSLAEALNDCSKLVELDLSHNNIGPKGAEKIASCLEKMMRLENLILENTRLESTGMIFICGGLANMRNLKMLSIGENKIGDVGIKMLSNIIQNFSRLRVFDIHRNEISINGSVYIGKCLESLKNLQVFKVGNNFLIKEGGNNVVTKLPNSLKELWMESTGVDDSHICLLAPLLELFKDLDVLILDHNLIGPKGATVLTEILPKMHLKTLSLIGCDVSSCRKALSIACENTEVLL
jgi:Ran GTPase-activating protein (RanGAP) involved in mRNA processing and transport